MNKECRRFSVVQTIAAKTLSICSPMIITFRETLIPLLFIIPGPVGSIFSKNAGLLSFGKLKSKKNVHNSVENDTHND